MVITSAIQEISGSILGYIGWKALDSGYRRDGDFSSLLCVLTGAGVHSASYKMSTGDFPRAAERTELKFEELSQKVLILAFLKWATGSTLLPLLENCIYVFCPLSSQG